MLSATAKSRATGQGNGLKSCIIQSPQRNSKKNFQICGTLFAGENDMNGIKKRLLKLEAKRSSPYADIEKLIEQHRLYDEITDEQRARYCEFVGIPQDIFEEIDLAVLGDLHTCLRKFDPPTPEELHDIFTEAKAGKFRI